MLQIHVAGNTWIIFQLPEVMPNTEKYGKCVTAFSRLAWSCAECFSMCCSWCLCATGSNSNNPTVVQRTGTTPAQPGRDQTKCSTETKQQKVGLKLKKIPICLCQVPSWTQRGGPTLPYSQQHTIWTCKGSVRRLPWRSRCTHSNAYTTHNFTIILTSQTHTLDLIITPYAYVRV